jgi:hypothetical protein
MSSCKTIGATGLNLHAAPQGRVDVADAVARLRRIIETDAAVPLPSLQAI